MPGFSNSTVYADNVDFTGSAHVQPQVTTDGQILIGATATPHIRVGSLGAGTNMVVTPGAGTLSVATSTTPSFTSVTVTNSPVSSTDATNKAYVDAIAAGFDFKNTTQAGSTAALNATYANGAGGVGATLTNAGALAAFSLDGVSPGLNARVLIKDQASSLQNGIYTVTTVGDGATAWVLTRATDYDTIAEVIEGSIIPVQQGTVNADTLWLQNSIVGTIGVDAITYQKFQSAPIITTQHAVLIGDIYNKIASLGPLTNGQLVIGNTGNAPSAAALTAGTGIGITNGAGTITINSHGGGLTWQTIGASGALSVNNGYVCTAGAALSFSLPATSAVGDTISITLDGSTSWTITQGAGQQIRYGNTQTTSGAGGSLASTAQGDTVTIVCSVANTRWNVISSGGNITVV